jgi:DNA-binding NarL/FixJ family response regulator
MGFWWNENRDSTNKNIPSLDSGITNFKATVASNCIFASEEFNNISGMFTKEELEIANYMAQGRAENEIAEILGISYKEVLDAVNVMRTIYNKIYQHETVSYEAAKKR